mmetsp:Transcript_151940/g.487671  ORF Transcript_151940/g.487671 Transcript_151940/m.487671 type:complete len:469 (-) Transcript_151940:106-1512(-)
MGGDDVLQWGISGVGLMPFDAKMRDVMREQDNMYTLWERGCPSSEAQVLGPHCEFLFAPEEHDAVVARLAAATTKVVTLTVTEKGYCSNLSTGALDTSLPAVQADLAKIAAGEIALQSSLGFLAAAAKKRMSDGAPPLAILSCDNVQENGHKLERCMLEFAALAGGPELRSYIESKWTFPNSMVDRITPATNDGHREAIEKEFGIKDQWPVVCEDKFPAGRPPWEQVLGGSCLMVEDVLPYELMKLRLLNGSHQAVGYCGVLAGHRAVDQAMNDPAIQKYITSYMDAVGQSVPAVPGVDLTSYKVNLRSRFSNEALKDQLLRLTEDARNRIQVACLPCLEGMPPETCGPVAAVIACWVRYLAESTDEKGVGFGISADAFRTELEPTAVKMWGSAKGGGASAEQAAVFLRSAFANPTERLLALAPEVARLLTVTASITGIAGSPGCAGGGFQVIEVAGPSFAHGPHGPP